LIQKKIYSDFWINIVFQKSAYISVLRLPSAQLILASHNDRYSTEVLKISKQMKRDMSKTFSHTRMTGWRVPYGN
jgi:hypothetical protein